MIELKKISDVFDVSSSKRVFKSEWTSEGVPFYRAREVVKLSKNGYVDNELFISEEMFQEYSKKYGVPKSGDILVTGVGTLGICYQVKDHDRFYFKDGNIVWLKKRENVSSDYIEYCFKSPFVKRQIQSTADAAIVGTYTITNARDTKIPLPPLDQQKKIAAILDTADAYRQKTKALIEKYDELTQSLFLDMFGDPVTNPKGWEIVTIRDIITEAKYGTGSKADENGIYSYLRMNNITYKGHMDYSNLKYINVPDDQIHKYETKKGDILFNRTNSKELVGKTGIIATDDKMILAGYLIRLRMKEAYNPYFLWSHLNSKWAKITLKNMCKSIVGMANINAQELQNIKVVDPPVDLQNQFAERVQAIEVQKAQVQASLAQAEDLFNSLLQRAFKGELTT